MDTSRAFAVIICVFKRPSNTPSYKSPTIFMLQCACMVSLTLITLAGAGALIIALR